MKKVEEIVEGFLNFLSSSRQLDLLPQIVKQLNKKLAESGNIAHVTSATRLTDNEQEEIRNFLKAKFGKNFLLEVEINADILGGLIIKVDDRMIDLSLEGKLKSLREQL